MWKKHTVYPFLLAEDIKWTLQRLFPYPEDMGPFESERYRVRFDWPPVKAGDMQVCPLPPPSSLIYYMELKYEKA